AIIWKTAKSRGKNTARIPLLPEARELLGKIKARQEAAMAARRKDKRTELPPNVLLNSYLRPWTAMGFGSRFNDQKIASGIDKHLHDLRGTFATRCMMAGLTDQQIADILGWSTKDVASIRSRYVDQTRVVIAIGEMLSKGVAAQ
ncbi:tyrosine-type recombinase/integrase, partial [Sphingomonas sp.]|uniref:tyrosine-type recombinase/integrase n=1 Tax=Sphingomonas sp. TaxID=28214 RepID=UPI003B3ABB81